MPQQPPLPDILDRPVRYLAGVSERRAQLLAGELGITTYGELLMHLPFRYIDRSRVYRVADLRGEDSTQYFQIRARVRDKSMLGAGAKARLSVMVCDPSGEEMEMVWFRGVKFVTPKLEIGREYTFFGKVSEFNGYFQMVHPDIEPPAVAEGRESGMQGIYSSTEKLSAAGLGTSGFHRLMRTLWGLIETSIRETLPDYILQAEGLSSRRTALHDIHFPATPEALAEARRRLKFEELFFIQMKLLLSKQIRTRRSRGYPMPKVGDFFNDFYNHRLPFSLTGAQQRVIKEIRSDMVGGHQMNRLVQGDVGSGKTVVALMCALLAADNGYQSALMAPTEILATQHHASIARLTEGSGFRVELLTGSTRKKKREEIAAGLADGSIHLLVGTHALIEDTVRFARLGFVVIDEQHRFGVMQRAALRKSAFSADGTEPHVLVMSATPIPRTLAMTLYGELDVSVIDELPPGRKPIQTSHARESHRLRLFGFIKEQIAAGRQVYVVYPLIKESEKLDIANLEQGYAAMTQELPPPQYVTAVVHGKMNAKEKEHGMQLFKTGQAHVLVSTTVIEVGVDVPNATVMIIESAQRFGLSQLHQLRGRVGRGGEQSYCVLMTDDRLGADAKRRMDAMVATNDGFELAELDMQLRGAGDIEGTAQSGQPLDIRVANLATDGPVLEWARGVAEKVLGADPALAAPQNVLILARLHEMNRRRTAGAEIDFKQIS